MTIKNRTNFPNGVATGIKEDVSAVATDGVITFPDNSATIMLTKAGVVDGTLSAPTATVHDGVRLTIISEGTYAHTIEFTSGFNDGGTANDIATFGGAAGDAFTVLAYQGGLYMESVNNVTLA